jgi:hypothetical protein
VPGDVGEVESAALLGYPGVEEYVHKHVAQLFAQLRVVALRNRLRRLIRLLQ